MRNAAVKALVALAAIVAVGTAGCAGKGGGAVNPETDEQKTLYALGLVISDNLTGFNLSEPDLDVVLAGVKDGVLKRERKVELQEFGPKIQGLAQSRAAAGAVAEKSTGDAFLEKAAGETGAVRTPEGLVYRETQPGAGPAPQPTDKVRVHYRGTLIDGTEFDSSYKRNEPATFSLNGVIPCWSQGVQKMKVGGKARLVCPPALAYGDRGAPPTIKPGATLVFEVELLGIEP
ncbi:MAG: FKBP-type peptidyl-prolyl cis-trans isomerase [Candidatus Polarisedimenticolia bacterium]